MADDTHKTAVFQGPFTYKIRFQTWIYGRCAYKTVSYIPDNPVLYFVFAIPRIPCMQYAADLVSKILANSPRAPWLGVLLVDRAF